MICITRSAYLKNKKAYIHINKNIKPYSIVTIKDDRKEPIYYVGCVIKKQNYYIIEIKNTTNWDMIESDIIRFKKGKELIIYDKYITQKRNIEGIYIPNEEFKNYLKKLLPNSFEQDKLIFTNEISKLQKIIFIGYSVENVDVIKYFTGLKVLDLSANQIKNIDLSRNTNLEKLLLYGNNLENIDLTHNTSLIELNLFYNSLKTIDLSSNHNLEKIDIGINLLENITINSEKLKELNLIGNNLTTLDLHNCVNLEELNVIFNHLKTLDLSNCPKLNANNVSVDSTVTVTYHN